MRHANGHGTRHPFATTARGRFVVGKPLLPVHALRFAVDCCCSSIIDWSIITGRSSRGSSSSMITRHGVMNEAARENESKKKEDSAIVAAKNIAVAYECSLVAQTQGITTLWGSRRRAKSPAKEQYNTLALFLFALWWFHARRQDGFWKTMRGYYSRHTPR